MLILSVTGDGNEVKERPIRKWPGVNGAKSEGSIDNGVNGREFIIASIWANSVDNSSKVKLVLPAIRFKWNLADLTPASQIPPKFGE